MQTPQDRHIIVVGGGIAGIACALNLARAGARVTLLEARRRLGGRATSFVDAQTGQTLDNCQHVTMGACTRYLALLEELGVAHHLEWHQRQWWIEPGGRCSVLEPHSALARWPEPLSRGAYGPSLLRAAFLRPLDKACVLAGLAKAFATDRRDWADATFSHWLERAGQTPAAIERFWRPIVVSACNLEPPRVCAMTALHVFQGALLAGPAASRIGLSRVPLVQLYDAAEPLLARAGGRLLLGESVEAVQRIGSGPGLAWRVSTRRDTLDGDAVVLAVPFEKASRLVHPAVRAADSRFVSLDAAEHSPILGVHLRFDRPAMDVPHAVLVASRHDTQWVFRKDDEGCHVHAVISAADAWMDLDQDTINARVRADLADAFPHLREAQLVHARAVKERTATFAATPTFERTRVGAGHPVPGTRGIYLAGDFTATGWPATMEGATRSGEAAADAIIGA